MNKNNDRVTEANAITFKHELKWLEDLFRFRAYTFQQPFNKNDPGDHSLFDDIAHKSDNDFFNAPLPDADESVFAGMLHHYEVKAAERAALLLAMLPAIAPGVLEKYAEPGYLFPILPKEAGLKRSEGGMMLPTGTTVFFLIGGADLVRRSKLFRLFEKDHFFAKHQLLSLTETVKGEPFTNGALVPGNDLMDLFLRGEVRKPDLRIDFPAKLLSSDMNWDDIVLTATTIKQLNEIELWLKHREALEADKKLGKKLKRGYRALFYGSPGTGKTLAACLLGKKTGKDVYRVDLSSVISKYIGETEKNLAKLFDLAEHRNWILFFDEADALFGKRTSSSNSANDRYANQEVAFLLQRIEDFNGLVILASNMKNNMDNAFLRRFQVIAHFPLPKANERLKLWQNAFSDMVPAAADISFNDIAEKYELSGSLILNIVSTSTLRALEENSKVITNTILLEGISKELAKESRTL